MQGFYRSQIVTVLIVVLVALTLPFSLTAQDVISEAPFYWIADGSDVEGSTVTLTRMEHGISVFAETSELEPGHVYTAWLFLFNFPENCSNPCGFDDVFMFDEDGAMMQNDDGFPIRLIPNQL